MSSRTSAGTSAASNACTYRPITARTSGSSGSLTSPASPASARAARARCRALLTAGDRGPELRGDLGGAELQYLAEHEHGPLPRRQQLHRRHQREPHVGPHLRVEPRIGKRLQPGDVERRRQRRPGIARSARPARTAAAAAPAPPARSGRRWSRSGTTRSVRTPGCGRTGRGPSTPAASSPAPGPRPRGTSPASGSSTPPAHRGTARTPRARHRPRAAARHSSQIRAAGQERNLQPAPGVADASRHAASAAGA